MVKMSLVVGWTRSAQGNKAIIKNGRKSRTKKNVKGGTGSPFAKPRVLKR